MPKALYSDAQNLMNINLIMVNEIANIRVSTIVKLQFITKLNFVNVEKKNTVEQYHHSLHRFISSRFALNKFASVGLQLSPTCASISGNHVMRVIGVLAILI